MIEHYILKDIASKFKNLPKNYIQGIENGTLASTVL